MCCETFTDLGCICSCDTVDVTVQTTYTQAYTIKYLFNGAYIERSITLTPSGGEISIPADNFNEDSDVTFELFNQAGTSLGCYKVNIKPCNTTAANAPTLSVDTTITMETTSCAASTLNIALSVEFSDIDAIQDGTVVYIDVLPNTGGFGTQDAFLDILGSSIIINDVSAMVTQYGNGFTVRYAAHNPGCGEDSYTAQVVGYDNLASGYSIGDNPITNYTYEP